jgi:hypothetical protein
MTDYKIKKLCEFLESRGLKKEAYMASLLPLLNMFGCGNDYDLREIAENNMENMFSPECIGSLHMPYNHEDFARDGEVGIPLDEFVSSYSSYDKVDVEYHSNSYAVVGDRNLDEIGIDSFVAVIFRNIPLNHPSWDTLGLSYYRDRLRRMWEDSESGGRLYIRDVYFYFPRLKVQGIDVVFANVQQVRCYAGHNHCSDPSSWYSVPHQAWEIMVGVEGSSKEDVSCREAVRRFFEEGPKDAEENL